MRKIEILWCVHFLEEFKKKILCFVSINLKELIMKIDKWCSCEVKYVWNIE